MRSAEFDTTNWQLIAAACSQSVAARRDALGEFFRAYSSPIRAWLRSRGFSAERADDLTQDFFKTVVLERGLLGIAESGRGRLRTLILAALRNHVIDAARHDAAVQRVEGRVQPKEATVPEEQAFDAEWARTQLERAIATVRARLLIRRPAQWEAFEEVVVAPALQGHAVRPLAEISTSLGLRDAASVSYLVHETKRLVRRELSAQISATVRDTGSFATELAHIESILAAAARRAAG